MRTQRLRTRAQFQALLTKPASARTAHFALHRLPPAALGEWLDAPDAVWIGAMAPKRWARRAVTRNAIKRQIFAVAALNATRLPPAAHVVRLRSAFDRKQFVSARSEALCQAVRAELLQLFERSARKALPEAAVAGSAAP